MGRPKLEIGTYGELTTAELRPGVWEAVARYRDLDGVTRRVKAHGASQAKAKAALRGKLKERKRTNGGGGDLTPDSTVEELAELWLAHVRLEHDQAVERGAKPSKSSDSISQYERCLEKVIVPALRKVTLRELRPQRVDRFLRTLPANGRMAKTVLSQICDLGVRYEALDVNPTLRGYVPPRAQTDRRVLTPEAAVQFRQRVHAWMHQGATHGPKRGYDRLRIVDVLLGTGIRIGEVLALAWADVLDLDSDHPTLYVGWHLDKASKRVEGRKSGGAPYELSLPPLAVEALKEQRDLQLPFDLVFPTRNGTAQSESNVRRHLREARGDDMGWVVPKTMRKTVSTAVYEAKGLEAAQRQLGHATPETTRRHYVKPSEKAPDNREALAEYSTRIRPADPQEREKTG
ncbi:site-specific integrase [Tsukamurella pseudospumae]|nr:site-specific integrase [Tsukamurella pseudospumae]